MPKIFGALQTCTKSKNLPPNTFAFPSTEECSVRKNAANDNDVHQSTEKFMCAPQDSRLIIGKQFRLSRLESSENSEGVCPECFRSEFVRGESGVASLVQAVRCLKT